MEPPSHSLSTYQRQAQQIRILHSSFALSRSIRETATSLFDTGSVNLPPHLRSHRIITLSRHLLSLGDRLVALHTLLMDDCGRDAHVCDIPILHQLELSSQSRHNY